MEREYLCFLSLNLSGLVADLTNMLCLVAQSCPTLCNPMDCSPPGPSVHGIIQERILEWVATPFSRGSSPPRDRTQVSHVAGRFFTIWATREERWYRWSYVKSRNRDTDTENNSMDIKRGKAGGMDWEIGTDICSAATAKSLQLCPTLSDPMDCSPPGSSIHGIFQARVLEWGAIVLSGEMRLDRMFPINMKSSILEHAKLAPCGI